MSAKAQLSEAHLVPLCQWNVRSLEGDILPRFEQWKQLVFGGYPHHLLHALLAVLREYDCQLFEMFGLRTAYLLYVNPPFGRCVLQHVLCVL